MEELVRTESYWMKTGILLSMKTMLIVSLRRLAACQFRLLGPDYLSLHIDMVIISNDGDY
jgi:hypothetical protein